VVRASRSIGVFESGYHVESNNWFRKGKKSLTVPIARERACHDDNAAEIVTESNSVCHVALPLQSSQP